ncbi:MAG: energy transducer TonB [Candidatus Symbiothrix sp.]|jgi:TonB family protein|nr:energy transducer TonB [Candidatus Symbiothrix sp.]
MKRKRVTKEQVVGWTGAMLIVLLLFLSLSVIYMHATAPPQEEGVLAIFEELEEIPEPVLQDPLPEVAPLPEQVTDAPAAPKAAAKPAPAPRATNNSKPVVAPEAPRVDNPTITGTERVPISAKAPARTIHMGKEAPTKEELAERQRLIDEANKAKRDAENQARVNAQVANALANGAGNGRSNDPGAGNGTNTEGNGDGDGDGSREGRTDKRSNGVLPGVGSFNLQGRSATLQRPAFPGQQEGIIIINITVDPQGNVINAGIRPGTTITNTQMRNSALEAAKKTKFNAIKAGENATGSITYRYKLN